MPSRQPQQGGGGQVKAKAQNPSGLPIVEKCVQQIQKKGRNKEEAMAICVKQLRKAGRIGKKGGQWVQVQPQQRQRQR